LGTISLKKRIKEGFFLLDGGMGTELIARGAQVGICNEYLNIKSPDVVFEIHKEYFRAGSDAVLTNTFGANKYCLGRHGLEKRVVQINLTAAELAGRAGGQEHYVLGDIGPSGDFLEPLGNLKAADLRAAYVEQAGALLGAGVDAFIIETISSIDEMEIIMEAVKSVSAALPVFVSMAFNKVGEDFRTMMGVDVDSAVGKAVAAGADAVGFNCGNMELDDYVELARQYVSAVKALSQETVVYAEPNAGKPQLGDKGVFYKVSPEDFAAAAERIYLAGVNIIGGCCGTGPAHIKALADKLRK